MNLQVSLKSIHSGREQKEEHGHSHEPAVSRCFWFRNNTCQKMKKTDARRELRGVGKSGARGLQESTGNEKQLCPAESRPLPRTPGAPPPIFLEEAGGREAGPSASDLRAICPTSGQHQRQGSFSMASMSSSDLHKRRDYPKFREDMESHSFIHSFILSSSGFY